MKIGLSFLTQIRGSEDPQLDSDNPFRRALGFVAMTFDQLVASIAAAYHTEHNDDDTHSTIHATGAVYERERTVAMGEWIVPAFSSAIYAGAGSMTWTVTADQQTSFAYMRVGTTLFLAFWVEGATLTGTAATSLRIALPENLVVASPVAGTVHYVNSASGVGAITASTGDRFISLLKADTSLWTLSSTVTVKGQIAIPVSSTGTTTGADAIVTYSGAASGTANLSAVAQLAFTTAGTYTLTVNRAMTLSLRGIAGGGGGGATPADTGADVVNPGAGGGGGGCLTADTTVSFAPAKTYTLIVPTGGSGGTGGTPASSGNNGTDGADGNALTLVNTTDTVTLASLQGGRKGVHSVASGANGTGGAGGASGSSVGSNLVSGGAGGAGGTIGAVPAVVGGTVSSGAGGGGGGGIASTGATRQDGAAGGSGSAAGGAKGLKGDHVSTAATAGGTASGVGGSATGLDGGGGGGGGGGAQFAGVTGQFGGGGGGAGPVDNLSSTGRAGGAGGAGAAVFVFVSKP